ncbi:MAG: AAA family ATPase [Magnetococcales bacterium]|nr:AAA family ATPase [Magnetococcales bacterium]
MYLNHFGLHRHPFSLSPDPELFFDGGDRENILTSLQHAIAARDGLIKVVGEVGTGKTTLCRTLCQRLPASIDVAILLNPNIPADQIASAILREFRIEPSPNRDRSLDHYRLAEHLMNLHRAGRNALVVIEEAQCLPVESMEELRLLSNIETDREKLFQIILFGQPELDRILARHGNRQFLERILHSYHLHPLSLEETDRYIANRLNGTGYRGNRLFQIKAVRKIHSVSEGRIRRINILAHKSLIAAYAESATEIQAKHVRAAVDSSEFSIHTPFPWRRPALAAAGLAALLATGALMHSSWATTSRLMTQRTGGVEAALTPPAVDVRTITAEQPAPPPAPAAPAIAVDTPVAAAVVAVDTPVAAAVVAADTPVAAAVVASQAAVPTHEVEEILAPEMEHPPIPAAAIPAEAVVVEPVNVAEMAPPVEPGTNEVIPLLEGPAPIPVPTPKRNPKAIKTATMPTTKVTAGNEPFTIQLMALSDRSSLASVEKILGEIRASLDAERQLNIVTLADHRTLIYVDTFPSREKTAAFIAALPAAIRANQPFVLPLKAAREREERVGRISG